jgi:hypothetical protein
MQFLRMNYLVVSVVKLLAVLQLSACATTGATFRSGVGDAFPEHPPYYAGVTMEAIARDTGAIGHLPVAFQRGASQAPIFDPRSGANTPMEALLEEMNAYLDSLGVSSRVADGRRVSAVAHAATAVPPDVRFGCIPDNVAANDDCAERGDSALGRGRQQMLLAVGRPSAEWIAWNRELMEAASTTRTLVITLEVGQYLTRQEGMLGKKVVELGTGNRVSLPWLTSLETPVTVLQLTASLVDREGKAVRIGAEGFYPRRTRLAVSALGGQELLSEDDVSAVRSYRRDDLPAAPIAWQVAMRELVARVTGRAVR